MAKEANASITPRESVTVIDGVEDCKHLFHGIIADLNFRSSSEKTPVKINKSSSVHDIVVDGPATIMEDQDPQLRWIHLPANNMSWVEELMATLLNQSAVDENRDSVQQDDLNGLANILPDDLWSKAFHGKSSYAIHARRMAPTAARYSSWDTEDEESDSSDVKWANANVTALFMPYLHWESYDSWRHRQEHIAHMKQQRITGDQCNCISESSDLSEDKQQEAALLHQYLYHDSPLHDRRTLDQSYYYNLRFVALRDEDQVIGQHTREYRSEYRNPCRKMMMTDQLWMWIIDGRTIVTAFPETSDSKNASDNVASLLCERLQKDVKSGAVRHLNSFVGLIINQCTGFFHRSDLEPELSFFEFFADEIGRVKGKLDDMYEAFHQTSEDIEQSWSNPTTTVQHMSQQLESLFSVKAEIKLMAEIGKILSDLDKIDFLCSQQEEVLKSLVKCSKADTKRASRTLEDLCEVVKGRREIWAGMTTLARERRESLQGLLDLKQRQANVSEARSIRYQISVSTQQGRSIMLLTIFTIFFLPISVMAAIFGMNATELVGKDGGKVSFGTISIIAFPVTIALVIGALAFAFKHEAKTAIIHFWIELSNKYQHSAATPPQHQPTHHV